MTSSLVTSALSRPPATLLSRASASPQVNCDGVGSFTCALGTCYTGGDGFIGCCSVSSCAARTTCLPFVAGSAQLCDTNTQGCVLCSSNAPFCVTITNPVAEQYIMYCDTKSLGAMTYSYENKVSTGSMALPPASETALTTSASATPGLTQASAQATRTAESSITATGDPLSDNNVSGISAGVIAGISVASLAAFLIVSTFIMVLLRKRQKERHQDKYEKSSSRGNGYDGGLGSSRVSLSNRLRKDSTHVNRFGITRTYASDGGTYLSPLEHDRLARTNEAHDAARIHELDSGPVTPDGPDDEAAAKKDWWKPPVIATPGPQKPSTRWSVNAAPTTYEAYQPNQTEPVIFELPGRQSLIPIGDQLLDHALNGDVDGVSPITEYSSPSLTINANSTRPDTVFALTPLLSRFQTGKPSTGNAPVERFATQHGNTLRVPRVSVDSPTNHTTTTSSDYVNPAARVTGPLTWPEPLELRSEPNRSSVNTNNGDVELTNVVTPDLINVYRSKSITNSTGGRDRYVSPETAISEGFAAGPYNTPEIAIPSVVSLNERAQPIEIGSSHVMDQAHAGRETSKKENSNFDGFNFET